MRKQTKLVAVLSAAALLAIGASMTSMAASGWAQENGQWYYYNNSGDYVTDEWKKSGNNYFYLGDDGYMLTNALIEDGDNYYYVDANGAMVKSQWVQIAADDSEDQDVDYRWYYFGPTGRAYKNSSSNVSKKTINGKKYAFDSDGKMLFGFVDSTGNILNDQDDPVSDATYYFGTNEDGAMYTGWLQYTDGLDAVNAAGEDYNDKESLWFYFKPSNGEKIASNSKKKINGYTYNFDENGVMRSGWQDGSTANNATTNKYFNGDEQGWLEKKGWVWAVPSEDMDKDDHDDDSYSWFYVGSNGETTVDQAKRINGKWYVFDSIGRMQDGLVVMNAGKISSSAKMVKDLDEDEVTGDDLIKDAEAGTNDYANLFYFSADGEKDGSMKTGSSIKIDLGDDTYTFSFEKNGSATKGIDSKKLYVNGVLRTAGDMRYDAVWNPYDNKVEVVGTSGSILKTRSSAKDADDNYYAVNKDGVVAKVEAGDYASKAANAFKNGDETFEYDNETYTTMNEVQVLTKADVQK